MNRNRWTPVAAVAAVLAMIAGYSLLSRDGGSGNPPVLRLAIAESSFAAAADSTGGVFKVTGTLPTGPSSAHVRDLPAGAASVDKVRALAAAVGQKGAPVRSAGAWKVGTLVVRDEPGNPWTWGQICGPDTPVSSTGVVTDNYSLPCGGTGIAVGEPNGSGNSTGSTGSEPNVGSAGGGSTGSEPNVGSAGGGSTGSGGAVCARSGTKECSVAGSPPVDLPSPTVLNCLRAGPPCNPCPDAPAGTPNDTNTGTPTGATTVPCVDVPGFPLPKPLPEPLPKPMPLPHPVPADKVVLTESQVLAATRALREALDLADAPTRVEGLSVTVDPIAGGMPTSGMATTVQLSSGAKIVSASGSMSTGIEGDLYPLRSARKALDSMPVMAMGRPCSTAGCPPQATITGARLGLSRVALDKGAAALLPAWLFTVKGSPVPLVALAVADTFLGGPDVPTTNPGAEPGTIEPGIGEPGSKPKITEPGPDGSITAPPASGINPPAGGREPFGFDGAFADANPRMLVVRYGDSGSCPSKAVQHEVLEQPDRVIVTLSRTAMPPDQACTMDYRAMMVRVALKAPLGGREIVDGSRKVPVPLTTGTPPLG